MNENSALGVYIYTIARTGTSILRVLVAGNLDYLAYHKDKERRSQVPSVCK